MVVESGKWYADDSDELDDMLLFYGIEPLDFYEQPTPDPVCLRKDRTLALSQLNSWLKDKSVPLYVVDAIQVGPEQYTWLFEDEN